MFKNTIDFDNICIVGSGAIGSAFGGFLSNAGYKVTFIEKNEGIIKQVKENGLSISGVKEIHLNNVTIVPPGSITQKQDLILFAVKAYSLEEAVKSTLPIIGKNTYVVCLQNGLGISEIISKYVSKEQIIEGIVWFPATMVKPGHIELLTFYEESIFGGRFQRSQEYAKKFASVLTSAGIPAKAVDNISEEVWRKAIPIIIGNSINAITRKNLGVISEIPELNESLFAIAQESLKIARAEGIELDEERLGKSMDNALEKGYEHKTSMLVDIINKRKTEVDFLNGKIIELGKKHNIQTPLNLLIYGLIKVLESG
ncbi:MAG: 2-dehydropantoate 2-reductase [Candidatus Methanoperedens sp.]|nr:2-dehydropantoate 2-reductase [Candidatus Methanoperedens sp.]MCZ7371519.1 2-dehydropantoate 2-reductase [Candidatus Methanoperedens sp.]